jgi:DUF4097 and DUF4098 domain-containing protein YvlB
LIGPLALLAVSAGAQPAFQKIQDDPWCRNVGHGSRQVTWCEVREATLPASAGLIDVDASPNGGAKAMGSDRSDIRLRVQVVAHADTEAEARDLAAEVIIETSPKIHARGPGARRGSHWWASFEVAVPRRADVKLTSVNGPVALTDVEGRAELQTRNGPVAVSGSGGLVKGRTENGPVSAELSGATWAGEGLDLATVNGPAVIRVPEHYSARLEMGTANGPLKLSFPLAAELQSRHDIKATLGTGGALLRVRTTNGPLSVRRP